MIIFSYQLYRERSCCNKNSFLRINNIAEQVLSFLIINLVYKISDRYDIILYKLKSLLIHAGKAV